MAGLTTYFKDSHTHLARVEMFQTFYLCLVTGRMYFYLSPPTSNLNNIIILFSRFETQLGLYNH